MPNLDVFNQDAFSVHTLTDAVNKMPFVPGLIGQLGIFEEKGISTTSVDIEEQDGVLNLIPTTPRGAPAVKNRHAKRTLRTLKASHLAIEDEIQADEVQNVRAFGQESALQTVQGVVNDRLGEMVPKLDATLEHLRIGAIKGVILDSDGSTEIYDLFDEFGVSQETEIDFDLDNANPAKGAVRKNCHLVHRKTRDNLGAQTFRAIWGICGSAFFDDLVSHVEVLAAYERWAGDPMRAGAIVNAAVGQPGDFLRMGLVERTVEYAGIVFQEYRGSVGGVDFIDANKCHFFPVGVSGLFRSVFAPADFAETVNTVGLPRYAKQAPDREFNRFVKLHAQSNPLNYCTRPKVLIKAKRT